VLAAHLPGDREVQDNKVKRMCGHGFLIAGQNIFPMRYAFNLQPELPEHQLGHGPDGGIVVQHQDPAVKKTECQLPLLAGGGHDVRNCWQVDRKCGAHANARRHLDLAPVLLDDGVGGGQPKSMADLLGGEVRLKEMGNVIFADALACVGNRYDDIGPAVDHLVLDGDGDRASVGHGLCRIEDQVLYHLANLALVRLDGPEPGRELEFAPDLCPVQGEVGDLRDDVGYILNSAVDFGADSED